MGAEGEGDDHGVARLARVPPVVRELRLAARDVSAVGAGAEVEHASASLALRSRGMGDRGGQMGAARGGPAEPPYQALHLRLTIGQSLLSVSYTHKDPAGGTADARLSAR